MKEHRIISLIASATEIVCALGFEKNLVGRSHECDYPPSVKNLSVTTEPKFLVEGTSYQIDERVKAIAEQGLSVYRVHAEMLEALQPTLLVTQDHCQVCAVSLRDVEEAVCQITSSHPAIVSLHPDWLADLWKGIHDVAHALGAEERGEKLITRLKKKISECSRRAKAQPEHPRVACIEWIEPLMSSGNWMPELVELAGGVNLFGEAGRHSPWMKFTDIIERDPDIILVLPCGFDIARTMEEMHYLTEQPVWKNLSAVKTANVYVCDGNAYFNRPGPRLVDSLEIMCEIFHPNEFLPRHEGSGWIRSQQ